MRSLLEFLARLERMIREACAAIWQGLRSRYVRELEAEVARLRAENRALLNSLLGTAGIPPLQVEPRETGERHVAPAVRRRSWQQLGRMLEIEEARRLRQAQQAAEVERNAATPSRAKPNGGGT